MPAVVAGIGIVTGFGALSEKLLTRLKPGIALVDAAATVYKFGAPLTSL